MIWTQAKVGCYWDCGDYHISTVSEIGRSYYRVALRFDEIGQTDTLDGAKALAQLDGLNALKFALVVANARAKAWE
jgi:hypothetical protein